MIWRTLRVGGNGQKKSGSHAENRRFRPATPGEISAQAAVGSPSRGSKPRACATWRPCMAARRAWCSTTRRQGGTLFGAAARHTHAAREQDAVDAPRASSGVSRDFAWSARRCERMGRAPGLLCARRVRPGCRRAASITCRAQCAPGLASCAKHRSPVRSPRVDSRAVSRHHGHGRRHRGVRVVSPGVVAPAVQKRMLRDAI
jgi:hypothetical protein